MPIKSFAADLIKQIASAGLSLLYLLEFFVEFESL